MSKQEHEFFPGDRVVVFDVALFRDDRTTPLSRTMQPATVLRWYGYRGEFGVYPSVIDVRFDHDGRESKGHFTVGVRKENLT